MISQCSNVKDLLIEDQIFVPLNKVVTSEFFLIENDEEY